ncbi:MAG: AI-2E family transporter [Anaerolineaceae bacterium]|nr:AI-2E family transporter [Anaerolineaceae bacterium]
MPSDNDLENKTPQASPREKNEAPLSPKWPMGFKLIIALILIVGFLLVIFTFKEYVSLVLVGFLFAFLLKPVVRFINNNLKLSWGLSVAIVYMLFLLLIIGAIAGGGTFLINQGQNIFNIIKDNLGVLNELASKWAGKVLLIGPFKLEIPDFNTESFSKELLARLQPMLGSAGSAVTKTVGFVGSTLFRLLIVYILSIFLIGDGRPKAKPSSALLATGYAYDMERFSLEINRIWNAFIRGQFTVIAFTVAVYSVVLAILGFPYFLSLALVAGLGRLVPYLGAWMTWITFGTAAAMLKPTPFGLQPGVFVVLVLAIGLLIDQFIDNGFQPRVMGNALSVHPAAIMISALISAQVFGLLGLILNAPILATVKLIGHYVMQKLMDQDPWEGMEYIDKTKTKSFRRFNKLTNSLTKGIAYTINSMKNWIKHISHK